MAVMLQRSLLLAACAHLFQESGPRRVQTLPTPDNKFEDSLLSREGGKYGKKVQIVSVVWVSIALFMQMIKGVFTSSFGDQFLIEKSKAGPRYLRKAAKALNRVRIVSARRQGRPNGYVPVPSEPMSSASCFNQTISKPLFSATSF